MNQEQVYQWMGQIQQHLGLGKWQSLTLAAFSLGVMASRRCTLSIVSETLGYWAKRTMWNGAYSGGWIMNGWRARRIKPVGSPG